MELGHDSVIAFAKSWGLFYLIGLAVAVLVYTFWPSNRKRFDRAKHSILEDEDRPADGSSDGSQDSPGERPGVRPGERPTERSGNEPCR